MAKSSRKLTIRNVVASYVKIVKPGQKMDNSGMEYSCQLVIPKDHAQVAEVQNAIMDVLNEAFPGENYQSMRKGLRDSDAEGKDGMMENTFFMNVKRPESFGPLAVYNRGGQPITPTNENIFSGCIINAVVSIYSFNTGGSRGVACGIEGVQIVDNVNVQRLDGTVDLGSAFQPLEGDGGAEVESSPFTAEPAAAATPAPTAPAAPAAPAAAPGDMPW